MRDFLEEMRAIVKDHGDTEQSHMDADKILCDLLVALGHEEIVKEYHTIEKWYA